MALRKQIRIEVINTANEAMTTAKLSEVVPREGQRA